MTPDQIEIARLRALLLTIWNDPGTRLREADWENLEKAVSTLSPSLDEYRDTVIEECAKVAANEAAAWKLDNLKSEGLAIQSVVRVIRSLSKAGDE